jgi:hypothetical protein
VSFPVTDGDVPIVLWTHGTQGFVDACGSTAQGLSGGAGNLFLATLGYAVAAPDYLGMNGWGEPSGFLHPYIAPEPKAVASLDAVRAARGLRLCGLLRLGAERRALTPETSLPGAARPVFPSEFARRRGACRVRACGPSASRGSRDHSDTRCRSGPAP